MNPPPPFIAGNALDAKAAGFLVKATEVLTLDIE